MSTLRSVLASTFAPLIDLIYPPRCPMCGAPIGAQNGLCSDCWSQLRIPGDPSCASCQRPFTRAIEGDGLICAVCLSEPPLHDGIAAATLYNDMSRQLVLALKHGRKIALAPLMARLLVARLPPRGGNWIVVPVPLHRWRLWSRGFNQAALLARELARATGSTVTIDALVRSRRTPSLGGLGKRARAKALAGAIAVNPRRAESLRGRQVVLVDDVLTSGATSSACVRALKGAGASQVLIACFARVLDEADGVRPATQSSAPQTETPGALTPGVP